MRKRPILIAYRRFELLRELLFAHGYLIDPGGRDPNEWREDPLTAGAFVVDSATQA